MAATNETIRLSNGYRLQMNNIVDAQTRDLVRNWATTWDSLQADWSRALNELASGDTWPSATTIRRNRRTLQALSATQEALAKLQDSGVIRVTDDARRVVNLGSSSVDELIASQLPAEARLTMSFSRVDERALAAMARRTTQRITSLASTIGDRSYSMILNHLIRGVAMGDNPRAVAAAMNSRLEASFFNSLHRMNIISRTEMLDAYRISTHEQMKANSDLLQGWQWMCEMDDRTCPSCWVHQGEIFPIETPGPEDHQQGRCTALPATRSWQDLGFDIPEPESVVPNGEEVFNSLPNDRKLEIMGQARLDALNSGTAWSDLSTYKNNPDWRGSYVATPVSAL